MRNRIMRTGRNMVASVTIAACVLGLMTGVRPSVASVSAVYVYGDAQIPENYDSYSLFLLCNPEWLLNESLATVDQLKKQFEIYGRTLGRKHAAVWFWRQNSFFPTQASEKSPEYYKQSGTVDVTRLSNLSRSSEFCQKFHLPPSEGPYIVAITVHPDKIDESSNRVVISLKGLGSTEIASVLAIITDQILITKLSQDEIGSKVYWLSWRSVLSETIHRVKAWVKSVTFSIHAKAFDLEVEFAPPPEE